MITRDETQPTNWRAGAAVLAALCVSVLLGSPTGVARAQDDPRGAETPAQAEPVSEVRAPDGWTAEQAVEVLSVVEAGLTDAREAGAAEKELAALRQDAAEYLMLMLPRKVHSSAQVALEKERVRLAFRAYLARPPVEPAQAARAHQQLEALLAALSEQVDLIVQAAALPPESQAAQTFESVRGQWIAAARLAVANRLVGAFRTPLPDAELQQRLAQCRRTGEELAGMPQRELRELLESRPGLVVSRLGRSLPEPDEPSSERMRRLKNAVSKERKRRNRRLELEGLITSIWRERKVENRGIDPEDEEVYAAVEALLEESNFGPDGMVADRDELYRIVSEVSDRCAEIYATDGLPQWAKELEEDVEAAGEAHPEPVHTAPPLP